MNTLLLFSAAPRVSDSPISCVSEAVFSYLYVYLEEKQNIYFCQEWTCVFLPGSPVTRHVHLVCSGAPLGLCGFSSYLGVTGGCRCPQWSSVPVLDLVETWKAGGHQHDGVSVI